MKNPKTIGKLGLYVFLGVAALFFAIPLIILILTSLKTAEEARAGSLFELPQAPSLTAYSVAWSEACIGRACDGIGGKFWNSVIITALSTSLSLTFASLNGFALSQWRLKNSELLLGLLLFGAFVPYQVMLYPLVRMLAMVRLNGTLGGIVIIHVLFSMPVLTLIFRNFYVSLPAELFKAARIDGAGFFAIYRRIVLPMSVNVAIVAAILSVTGVWNDYLLGLIFAGPDFQPMMVSLNALVGTKIGVPEYNVNMAATILAALPPLLLYVLTGKYFVKGVTAGAVKG